MSYENRTTTDGDIVIDVELYERLKMAYKGSGDFADGNILLKHDRETADGYIRRKKSISYANYFRPVIDVAVNAVFSKDPSRSVKSENVQWDAFIKNVDGRNNLTAFVQKAATVAKKLGSAWIFMDNDIDAPVSLEEAVRDRKMPYLFIVEPQMIKTFEMDHLGNLISVSYYERYTDADGDIEYAVRCWTKDRVTLTATSQNKAESAVNNLGLIPCVPFIGSGDDLEEYEIPFPDYTNIYQLNTKIVNVDSLLTNGMFQQGFSILLLAGSMDKDLEIGESSAINYDKEGTGTVDAPSFIAPDAAPLEMMMKYMDVLKTQIQEQSVADFTTTKSESQSGIAKRLDNLNRSEHLENFATYIEAVEVKVAKLFGLYTSSVIELTSEYNKDFDIDDITTSLEQAIKALGVEWDSQDVKKAIKEDTIRKYFSEKDQEAVEKLVESEKNSAVLATAIAKAVEGTTTPNIIDGGLPTEPGTPGVATLTLPPADSYKESLDAILATLAKLEAKMAETAPTEGGGITQNVEMPIREAINEDPLADIKNKVFNVLYDVSSERLTEAEALKVLASYGFSTKNAKAIIKRATIKK